MEDTIYQTLEEFLFRPFGIADAEQEKVLAPKYAKNGKYVKLVEYSVLDGEYFLHLVIPSESKQDKTYDVVLQFFHPDEQMSKHGSLNHYLVQFFSNSPSFIYRYAALYKLHGYLIDSLQDRLDVSYIDKMPDKTNKEYKMSYDKSLYFACRYLYEHRLTLMTKAGLFLQKKVPFREMVRHIIPVDILEEIDPNIEEVVKKETKNDKKKAKEYISSRKKVDDIHRVQKKSAAKSTIKEGDPGIKYVQRKRGTGKKPKTRSTIKR